MKKLILILLILLIFLSTLSACSTTSTEAMAGANTKTEASSNDAEGGNTTIASEGTITGKGDTSGKEGTASNQTVDATAGKVEDPGTKAVEATQEASTTDETTNNSSDSSLQAGTGTPGESSGRSVYRLKEPDFIKLDNIPFCKVAEDYINLPEDVFSKKYSADELWKYGAFDRLLFTGNTKGKIIADIGIGSSLQQVTEIFGKSQFGTKESYNPSDFSYKKYLLYGYKTRDFYFTFQIDPATKLVQSVCFRKRYVVPENRMDMMLALAKYDDWYGSSAFNDKTPEWSRYFENDKVRYAQWGRGTMTMICDYGFTSSAGMGVSYEVYKDFSGNVPILQNRKNEFSEGDYQPLTVIEMDYPEWMIYRIYSYLIEQSSTLENKTGMKSPDGSIYAYAADDGDWLNMELASGLYETAHVVFHWMDASKPDRHVYFGHYSTVIGYIGNRYFVESDMMGLHVLDLQNWQIVYKEEDVVDGRSDLRIDEKKSGIYAEDGSLQYSYKLGKTGKITVRRVAG